MIHSMTGYGRSEVEKEGFKIIFEVKSVNHRYNDIVIKSPRKLAVYEDLIKSKLKEKLQRGRIEVFINIDETRSGEYNITPNFNVIDQYYKAYKEISERFSINDNINMSLLTRNPDALVIEYKEVEEELVKSVLTEAVENAIDSLVKMREVEGEKLKTDIQDRVTVLKNMISSVEEKSPLIVEEYKQKLNERISQLLGTSPVDEQKLAQEVAYFADRTNVTEEIVRLASHFDQVNIVLEEGGSIGRKLDFLVQEMNREVNTIGSKSPDVGISNLVIEIKSEMEKIREQIQNIE